MNEQTLNQLFAELGPEELIEALLKLEQTDELKAMVKNQLGQEFIKLLAIGESLDIDLEDAINDAITELGADLDESGCNDEECCEDDDCKTDSNE